jgi:hypothetical protein
VLVNWYDKQMANTLNGLTLDAVKMHASIESSHTSVRTLGNTSSTSNRSTSVMDPSLPTDATLNASHHVAVQPERPVDSAARTATMAKHAAVAAQQACTRPMPIRLELRQVTAEQLLKQLSNEELLRLNRELQKALQVRGLARPQPRVISMVPQPLPAQRHPSSTSSSASLTKSQLANAGSRKVSSASTTEQYRAQPVRLLPAPLPSTLASAVPRPPRSSVAANQHGHTNTGTSRQAGQEKTAGAVHPASATRTTTSCASTVANTTSDTNVRSRSGSASAPRSSETDSVSKLESVSESSNTPALQEPLRHAKRTAQEVVGSVSEGPPQQRPRLSSTSSENTTTSETNNASTPTPSSSNTQSSESDQPVTLAPAVLPISQGDPHPPRALPATPPITKVVDGVEWIEFSYSVKGANRRYLMRADVHTVDLDAIPQRFKHDNCLYPRADVPREEYRGNRWRYENDCNHLGWRLAWLNRDVMAGKRGLLQRAVDSYRNRYRDMRSRRVARLEKLAGGAKRKGSGQDSTQMPGKEPHGSNTTEQMDTLHTAPRSEAQLTTPARPVTEPLMVPSPITTTSTETTQTTPCDLAPANNTPSQGTLATGEIDTPSDAASEDVQHANSPRGPKCLTFKAIIRGTVTRLRIRVDLNEAEAALKNVSDDFRQINAIYPRALCPREQYTGTRWELETRCNDLACKLVSFTSGSVTYEMLTNV